MEHVIVTGGTGFLGRNVIRHLSDEGYRVYAIVRPESRNKALLPCLENVVPVYCSLSDISKRTEFREKEISAFYHFAWAGVNRREIDDEEVHRNCMEESLEALHGAIRLGCGCFLFSGSRSEYGALQGPFREDAVCAPQVAYGRYKLEFGSRARKLCEDSGTQYIHARIFSVYGPDDHPWSLICSSVKKMLKNEAIDLSSCTQLWNFMDVRDMANLFLTFHRRRGSVSPGDTGIFNVATDDIRPLREYVEEIARITGSKSELRFGTFQQGKESALSVVPDMSKVSSVFGWKAQYSFSEGIRRMVEQREAQNA